MRSLFVPRLLALSIGFALNLGLADSALAANSAGAGAAAAAYCPLGVVRCPKKEDDFSLCKPNDLLKFYDASVPKDGDRTAAPADMKADRFYSPDSEKFELTGNARLLRVDQLLQADKITYDSNTTGYTAAGNVRYQDRGMLMSADQAKGTTTPSTGTLDNVQYQILSSRGNGTADQARVLDADHAALDVVSYSTCDLADRRWEIRAKDMTLDQDTGIGRAHDVTMRWHDTPFFWLPYARFPIDDRRQGGFLYPTIGSSNNGGFDFTLPYYLNLAPNYDATLFPRIIVDRGFMLGGEFRYLTDSSKGQVEFTYLPHDREASRERGYFHFEDFTYINAHWGLAVNLNDVSDDRYFEDFGRTLTSVATSLLPSSAYLNGRGSWWTASVGGDRYQITDPTLSDLAEPYQRLPRATFEGEHDLLGPLRAGIKSEFVSFHKDCSRENGLNYCPTNGQRLDLYPYLALPLEGASWFLRPEFGVRNTSYSLSLGNGDSVPVNPVTDKSPNRTVPIGSLDAGLVFERDAHLFGSDFLQTLEPRLFYLRVPYRNQSDLPVFDTQEISFDFGQLFRTNRFTGADRQEDANNLTLALTSRLLESDSGVERLSASFGQIRYFDDQRVQLPGAPLTDYSGSDYVGQFDLRLNDRWRLSVADQWDPNHNHTDLGTFSVQRRLGEDGVLNVSYRYRRDFLEQGDISALIPISERWRLVGRWNYSMRDSKTLESFFGVEHDDCCTAWRILARHYVHNIAGDSTNALYFELEFKGIGAIGQKTDDFLRRAILGYR